MTRDEIQVAALALSETDRVVLIEALEESFQINDPTLTPRQRADLAERIAEFEADPEGTTVDGETALRQLKNDLAERRKIAGVEVAR